MSEPLSTSMRARTTVPRWLCWILLTACSEPPGDATKAEERDEVETSNVSDRRSDAGQRPPETRGNADGGARDAGASVVPSLPVDTDRASCGGASFVAQGKELEVLVLFDNSLSMALPAIRPDGALVSLWEVAVTELTRFVEDERSRGISLALKYFGSECNPDAYRTPDVDLVRLPEQGAAIAQSLRGTLPIAQTATRPALEGALAFLRQRASSGGREARQIILLVTDGYPDEADCMDNSTQSVSRAAAAGLSGQPSIATYRFVTVTGLLLDEIAKAGGTDKAVLADLAHPGALSTALEGVRDRELLALPCEYDLPPAYFREVNDPSLVNLTRDGKVVPHVQQAADCSEQAGGWYYDDAESPLRILTCPATCTSLKSAASVNVQLHCPTVLVI
jgi:hypothetical protein